MSKKLTTDEFINKSKQIHGDKYDYSLVNYINNRTKVKIICPIHGIFEQIPQHHLNNSKCSKCSNNFKLTTSQFINKSKQIHGDKYDYSLVNYINNSSKIKIICPVHGIFEQLPTSHINQKQGCAKCNGGVKLTTIEFINNAKKVHSNKYDYSLCEYINAKLKIKIICKKHGIFEQLPDNHINKKYGCPMCNESKGEKEIQKILKLNNIKFEYQKTFNDCKFKQSLKFDFYLSDYNMCIEFDGKQHFEKYRFEKNNEKLKLRQLRDKIKNNYCKINNIKLIRNKYNDNIIKKLSFFINKNDLII